MIELSGRLLIGGALRPGRVVVEGERIRSVELGESLAIPTDAPIVAPGAIDLHVHGFAGGGPLDELEAMARGLARAGTTAFLPTMFPAAPERLGEACERVAKSAERLGAGVARPLGLHLEGPFVNPRAAGALPVEDLAAPSVAALRAILGASTGSGRGVRTVTLAPELPRALELVDELVRCGVRVSLGHSLASAGEARSALDRGARGATHLFNAMRPFHHREAGIAGVAMTADGVAAEIIGDLAHVGREAFELALRARGPNELCLVSDALAGAGTGCDRFHWHGREHLVREGTAYYPPSAEGGEPKLAGSAMSQLEMVRRLVERGVVSIEEALTMASTAPARALGEWPERGAIAAGSRADVIVLDPRELALLRVLAGGVEVALVERAARR